MQIGSRKRASPNPTGRPCETPGIKMRGVNVVLRPSTVEHFEALANERGTSRAYEIRQIIEAYLIKNGIDA